MLGRGAKNVVHATMNKKHEMIQPGTKSYSKKASKKKRV